MKIYNGYPDEVQIDGTETTVHDVNRMLLSLMWDKRLIDPDKEYLSRHYRTERQQYLDAQDEMTEENRQALQAVEQKLSDEIQHCEARLKRLKQRELEKKAKGMRSAKRIHYYLEVANYSPEENESYNSEDIELWDYLFGENRLSWHWGLDYGSTIVEEREEQCRWKNRIRTAQPIDKETFKELNALKEKYHVAWQDVQKIKNFMLTIRLEY